ncbi:MAG: hypothetical protein RR626_01415, partial [Anaerovoracaceae bacterium]
PKMVSAPPVEPIQQSKKVPPPPIEDAQQEEPRIYRPKPKNTQQKYPKLPPGFRRLKPLNMIFASFLYLSILGAGMTLTLDDPTAPLANVYIERVGFLLFWFTMIAYYGNYLGLRNRLFLHNQPSKGKPILAYIFWTFALSSIIFIPMMILQNIIAGR